jgi:UDP-N-acetylmuramate--alanine ligase
MVVEADESDRSFLRLTPTVAVVTNIDEEHLEAYRDFDDLRQAFLDFANKVPFYGAVIACADDPHVRSLVPRMRRREITYGLDAADADVRGADVAHHGGTWTCRVVAGPGLKDAAGLREPPRSPLCSLRLPVPGRHNLQNALAAVAVGLELGLDAERVAGALASFAGADRRFQRLGEAAGVLVIDDYGHHPTEIRAVLDAARASLGRRLIVAFQPHRYSRTARLMDRFGPALAQADELVLADIYAASEDPIPGVTIEALAETMRPQLAGRLHLARTIDDVVAAVASLARPGDAVITLGAGSIGTVGPKVLAVLGGREGGRA